MNNNIPIVSLEFKDDINFLSNKSLEKTENIINEFGGYIYNKDKEYLLLIATNAHGFPVSVSSVAMEDIKNSTSFSRDIISTISISGACAFIVMYNRIGAIGASLKPSVTDENIVDYFSQLSRLSLIPMHDVIIVGDNNNSIAFFSYREKKKKKITSVGKNIKDMFGAFHIDRNSFPDAVPVKNGWAQQTVFQVSHTKEELFTALN